MKNTAAIIGMLGLITLVILIHPLLIYCLWDDTFVKFFNTPDVTFVDSIWISIICNTLFKNTTNSKTN